MSASLVEFELWTRGDWTRRDVVGESFHAEEIRSLFPPTLTERGQELVLRATLLPEQNNPHDPNAIAVTVQGRLVGYLSREDAVAYRPVFMSLMHRGLIPVTPCRIWGRESDDWVGVDRRGREITKRVLHASVSLALDEWYLCIPVNQPPLSGHTMLPYGSAIQVRKEEDHQDTLRRYVSKQGECWAHGTLHPVVEQGPRSSKRLVEIRIDGERVGDLTPAMSAEYLPVMEQLAQLGQQTAVRLIVKGNQVKAEVVLHAMKAHQLPADWIAENLSSPIPTPVALAPEIAPAPVTRPLPQAAAAQPQRPHPTPPFSLPPKPQVVFQTPPGWPTPPPGFEPGPEWRPDPSWPAPPPGWQFWQLR